jgi:hypothetical protein
MDLKRFEYKKLCRHQNFEAISRNRFSVFVKRSGPYTLAQEPSEFLSYVLLRATRQGIVSWKFNETMGPEGTVPKAS